LGTETEYVKKGMKERMGAPEDEGLKKPLVGGGL